MYSQQDLSKKECRAYSEKYINEDLRLYGYTAAYELIMPFYQIIL